VNAVDDAIKAEAERMVAASDALRSCGLVVSH